MSESNRMNSLKTLYSRITTLPASTAILESVGVAVTEIGESGEQVRPVTSILSDLGEKWVYLTDSQRQNVGVQIAGRNQLSRFLALMNNHETAVEATTTALNSQGSAMRENQAYLTSYEANVNRMKTAFSGLAQSMGDAFLKSGLSIGIESITSITKAVAKLIDTVGLLPVVAGTLSIMFGRMGSMGKVVDGLFPSIIKLKDSIVNLNTSAGKADFAGKMTNGLGKIKGVIGGIVGTMASMALVTGAIIAVSWAVEKLINKYQEAKAEAKKVKDTQDAMVESYRTSGDSLTKMADQYDVLYKKYGEFNSAVASGKIDPDINTEDYELYSSITDELASKLPTVIKYTDAQGVAHLKTGEAVKKQLEYAKQLSVAQAELELQEIGDKMAEGAEKATEAYKDLLDVRKELADLEANKGKAADTLENDDSNFFVKAKKYYLGEYDGASFMETAMGLGKIKDAQAELAVSEEQFAVKKQGYLIKEIEARNKVQSSIADQLTIVKDYSTAYMEANGHVENLGSTSQAVVQNFAQMNSGYLDAVVDMDLNAEDMGKQLEERSSNLAQATETISDMLNSAYEKGLGTVDMSGTLAEDKAKVEEYGLAFEGMVSMIPKSMMTINESTGQLNGEVSNLIGNFQGLSTVNDGIADKSMSYTDARIALEKMGVTGKDADQMIRNFAQTSGNAQIEASLLATTVDESAQSMSNLKDATLDTVDALSGITGVSAENASALSGYLQGLDLSKSMFGEAYESSELYSESLAGLATYYGMSEEAVLNNLDGIKLYEEALSSVTYEQDENGNSTIKVAEMSAEAGDLYAQATEKMKENGLSLEQNMQMIIGIMPDLASAFESVSSIDFTNTEDETSRLATTFLTAKDGSTELQEAMQALGETHPDLYTIRNMFTSFSTQIDEGTADFQDFRDALEGQLEPPEIDALIQAMEQITGKEEEVKNKHNETKDVIANNPFKIAVIGAEESEEKIRGVHGQLEMVDDEEATVKVSADKATAQADLDAIIAQAISVGATEAQVKASVEGVGTASEQLSNLAKLIEDLSGGTRTAGDVLSGLGSNVDTSTAMGKVAGVKASVDGLSEQVKNQVSEIQSSVKELNGMFDGVNLGVESVGNLKNILADLNGAVDTAKGGVLNSVAQVNTALIGISGQANPAITAMSNMKNTFNELKASLTSTSSILTTAGGGFTTYASSVSSVSYSANTARDAINSYAQSLASSANSASVAQSRVSALTQAKQAESSAFLASKIIIASTGDAYGSLAGKSSQTASKINSDSMRIIMAVIRMSNAYKTHVSSISGVIAGMSRSVSGSTSSMISQHNRQADAIKRLASTARDAKGAISTLNSAVASSMGGMLSFISRAKSTATQAEKTRSAVNKMREANSGNGIVGAVRNFIGMSTDRLVTAITEIDTGSAIGSLYSAISSSGATGSMSANAGGETSIGATGGTSGTIKASFYPTADVGMDGKMAFGALATSTEEKEDAYSIDTYSRKYSAIELALTKVAGQMERLDEASASYRAGLANQIKLENQRLALVNQELNGEKSKLKSIESQLKKLPAVGKQTVAQRKKYNELQKSYDETLSSVNSLTKEQQDLTNSAIENTQAQFESLINEITGTYATAIGKIQSSIDELDFKIELLSYTDPDNMAQEMKLMVERQSALMKQESNMRNQNNALKAQYDSALKKYGANDDRTLFSKEAFDESTENLRKSVLEVKKAEKEIKDVRSDIAKESIDKLKDYYGNMSSMAKDAIKAEQDALEKAYKEREKLYDSEIEKIESVYDAKMKSIDDADAEAEYQEQMSGLNKDRAELQRQIATASRDTSLLGKKNLAELQTELTDINKEISEAQKKRQAELLKEQLEAERDAQVKAIEDKKTVDEEKTNTKVEDLEKKATDIEQHFDNILDNDAYWDKLQNDVTNGKFAGLMSELEGMYKNIGNMNNGVFDGLLKEFSSFSSEAQQEFLKLNESLLKNMKFSDGTNSLDQLKSVAGVSTGTGNTTQKALGTPDYLGKWSTYSADNVLVSSGTAPAPTPTKTTDKAGKTTTSVKPVTGGTYVVKKDVPAYYTSDDAKARRDKRGTVKKGTYYIYNIWNGMINVTNKKGAMGSWINPNDNAGGVTSTGSVVKSSLNTGDGAQVLNNEGGGYGSGVGNMGSISANAGEGTNISSLGGTSGILSASSAITKGIMEKVSSIAPKINIGGFNDMLEGMVNIASGDTNNYNLTMPIENFNGTRKERDNVLDKFEKEMQKLGK